MNASNRAYTPSAEYADTYDRLARGFATAGGPSRPIGIAVYKVAHRRALEDFCARYPSKELVAGSDIRILRIRAPETQSSFVLRERLADAAHGPKLRRSMPYIGLSALVRHGRTRMIVVDEFQNLTTGGSRRVAYQAIDWLRYLAEDTQVALVVAGVSLESLGEIHAQLHFMCTREIEDEGEAE
jgi:hypothetical protein